MKWFAEDIADAERLVHSACELFDIRRVRKEEYDQALTNLENKKANLSKVQGVSSGDQVSESQQAVNSAEQTMKEKKKLLADTSKAVLNEIDRFRRMHVEDFERLILDFSVANEQVDGAIAKVWESVVEQVKSASQREMRNSERLGSGAGQGSSE